MALRTKEQMEEYFANCRKKNEKQAKLAEEIERRREEKEAARRAEIDPNIHWEMVVRYKSPKYPNGRINKINYNNIELEREAVQKYNNWITWAAKKNVFCEIEAYKVTPDGKFKWEPPED